MSQDRRKHPRVALPMDGNWSGASGGARCRITDISLGGCFVQALSPPPPGEKTIVTVMDKDGQPLALPGSVVYSELGLGFAVEFADVPPNDMSRLSDLIADLAKKLSGG